MFELKKDRLFVFGCSWTNYIWPTWADILGRQFNYYENWATPGAGNTLIFNRVIEASVRHQFTPDDTIIIEWSGLTRSDGYKDGGWHVIGSSNNFFGDDDVDGYVLKSYAYIHAVSELLSAKNLNYRMISMNDISMNDEFYELYKSSLSRVTPFPMFDKKSSYRLNLSHIKNTHLYNTLRSRYDVHKGASWPNFDNLIDEYENIDVMIKKEIMGIFGKNYDFLNGNLFVNEDMHPSPGNHYFAVKHLFPDYSPADADIEFVDQWEEAVKSKNFTPYKSNTPKIKF